MLDELISILAPHTCCNCRAIGSTLCANCRNDIILEPYERCVWCLAPTLLDNQCNNCQYASAAWSVGDREGTLRVLLGDLKFNGRKAAAHDAALLLDETIPRLPLDTIVTYVPTASTNRRRRGYDHAQLIAQSFAKRRELRCRKLLGRKHSFSQHELKNRRDRQLWANKTFYVSGTGMSGEPILLIDDIMTTGATMRACLEQLRQHAPQVYVASVARQPPSTDPASI